MRKPRPKKDLEYHEVGWAPDSTITGKKHFWTSGRPLCRADASPPPKSRRVHEEAALPICEACDRLARMCGTREAEIDR